MTTRVFFLYYQSAFKGSYQLHQLRNESRRSLLTIVTAHNHITIFNAQSKNNQDEVVVHRDRPLVDWFRYGVYPIQQLLIRNIRRYKYYCSTGEYPRTN